MNESVLDAKIDMLATSLAGNTWENEGRPECFYVDGDYDQQKLNADAQEIKDGFIAEMKAWTDKSVEPDNVALAKYIWNKLGDIPVNEDGELESFFVGFEPGAERTDVWHWFEDFFDVPVADLLFP